MFQDTLAKRNLESLSGIGFFVDGIVVFCRMQSVTGDQLILQYNQGETKYYEFEIHGEGIIFDGTPYYSAGSECS
ncbi:MAG: hypothetical protein GY868_03095 [Deltaproteobacteria bacterium]|nr:hypothetical protein [Deltaproteobacteria bacterium]